jgi:hypothetical protein
MVMLKACTRKRKDKRRSGSRHDQKRNREKKNKKLQNKKKHKYRVCFKKQRIEFYMEILMKT